MLRLVLSNVAYRMGELGERLIADVFGETLIDAVKARWQPTVRAKGTR